MDSHKLLKLFFHISAESIPQNVIISPIIPVKLFKPFINNVSIESKTFLASESIAVLNTMPGASNVGDTVLMLKNTKCQNIVFIGSCGVINGQDVGGAFSVNKALSHEGFSSCVEELKADSNLKDGKYFHPSGDMHSKLEIHLKNDSINIAGATVFTAGSLFCETNEFIEALIKQGFDCIEMECSAFYCAAKSIGLNSSAVLYSTDIPHKKPFYDKPAKTDMERIKNTQGAILKSVSKFLETYHTDSLPGLF